MRIKNTYFIIPTNSPLVSDVLSVCVQKNKESMRKSKDGRMIFKLPVGTSIPSFLKSIKKFNHTEIHQDIARPEWKTKSE